MIQDVEVIITRETAALTQAGFGLPLILATNADVPYGEYTDIASVADDYDETTAAYKIAARVLGQAPSPPMVAMVGVEYDPETDTPDALVAALNELVETRNDWYFLLCDQQGDAEITALSNWIDAQKKLYFASTDNLTLVNNLESERTAIIYHTEPKQYPAEGWVGRCAPELPGSITWKFKTINGVTAADIKVSELTQLHNNGGNSYVRKLGVLQTSEGKVTSGEYIDVIRSQDFIEARLTEQVSRLLFTQKKVSYDNSGIAMIVAECESVMKRATTQGIIALDDDGNGMWSITAPRREGIPSNDIANRRLNGIVIEATLAGAVHNAKMRVILKY